MSTWIDQPKKLLINVARKLEAAKKNKNESFMRVPSELTLCDIGCGCVEASSSYQLKSAVIHKDLDKDGHYLTYNFLETGEVIRINDQEVIILKTPIEVSAAFKDISKKCSLLM